jgi:NDP-sugar pyrophosphorylase family protein
MKVIIPINGKNERMGELFKTPKHLLLYKGIPAIERTVNFFSAYDIVILTNDRYIKGLSHLNAEIINVGETDSQVDTIRKYDNILKEDILLVDCDIIPIRLNIPTQNTVFCFENKQQNKQYSNYLCKDGDILDCNEKEATYPYAGAGIYYFTNPMAFYLLSKEQKSISGVIKNMLMDGVKFKMDTNNEIFRFGTLNDIIGL